MPECIHTDMSSSWSVYFGFVRGSEDSYAIYFGFVRGKPDSWSESAPSCQSRNSPEKEFAAWLVSTCRNLTSALSNNSQSSGHTEK